MACLDTGAVGSAKHTGWNSSPNFINNKVDKSKYENLDISAFMVPNQEQPNHITYRNTIQDEEGGYNA